MRHLQLIIEFFSPGFFASLKKQSRQLYRGFPRGPTGANTHRGRMSLEVEPWMTDGLRTCGPWPAQLSHLSSAEHALRGGEAATAGPVVSTRRWPEGTPRIPHTPFPSGLRDEARPLGNSHAEVLTPSISRCDLLRDRLCRGDEAQGRSFGALIQYDRCPHRRATSGPR